MERYDHEERQRRRNQGSSERSQQGNSQRQSYYDDARYGRDRDDRDSDFDRYSGSRYGRDSESGRGSQGNQDRFSSQYSSNERYNTGGSDRYEYRPQEDYRSLRDDSRYDTRGGTHSQKAYNEFDQRFDSNLGGRSPSSRRDWDYDRTSSYPSYGSSSGYSPYGSNPSGSGQSFGSHQGSYGSQYSGQSGSFGQNPGYGSSQSYGQDYGRYQGQGYNSSLSYGSQSGQGNSYQGQSRWGSESFAESKAGRAPKGYKRSDERIKEEISDLLTSHHEIDPSEVEIKVSAGEVTLTGNVSNRNEKRMIEDLASQISGVSDVTNQLRVQQSHDSSRSSSSSTDGQQHKSSQNQGFGGQTASSQKEGGSSKSIQ